jgi:hypothetical protein
MSLQRKHARVELYLKVTIKVTPEENMGMTTRENKYTLVKRK